MWIEASSGETATPITPSDSTPVALAANTAVKPTESGYAIKSSPASVTPNNANPVYLTKDTIIKPTDIGYAIRTYTNVTPSDASPTGVSSGIFHLTDSGHIIKSFPDTITPLNSDPAVLTSGKINKMGRNGYAIQSYRDITPSDDFPTTFYINQICRFTETGNVIKSFPENIIPSDTSPETLISGKIYKMDRNGYAIKSFSSVEPSLSGTYFPSGFVNMNSSGYAYSQKPGIDFGGATNDGTTASTSHVMAVSSSSYYIVLVYMNSSSSQLAYNRFDSANIVGNNGLWQKLSRGNLTDTNAYVVGTFFQILTSVDTSSITITTTNNSRVALIKAQLV